MPPEIPEHVADLIIVGGTFDPPHLAHTRLPAQARSAAGLGSAWMLFVPAARNPLKVSTPRASDEDRLAMLELATESIPRCSIWDDELSRSRVTHAPSYTIDTLRRLSECIAAAQPARLRLLIGTDQATAFHLWREPREILKIAPPLVMLRGTDSSEFLQVMRQSAFWDDQELQNWSKAIVHTEQSDISSTRIRTLLESDSGRASAEVAAAIDHSVLAYIRRNGLYKSSLRTS